jgi:prephenate dehydrogenase
MDISVGVVGLGIMGGAIVEHIARQSEAVYGYDIDEQAKDRARGVGVRVTENVPALAQRCAIVMTSLPGYDAAKSVIDDIAATAEPGCIIAELSTFSLDQKLALRDKAAAAGHVMIDCPLSGTGAQSSFMPAEKRPQSNAASRSSPNFRGAASILALSAMAAGSSSSPIISSRFIMWHRLRPWCSP